MKTVLTFCLVFFGAVAFCGAEGIAEEAVKGNEKADTSYAFGMVVASDLVGTGLEFNYDAFVRGFRQTLEKEETRYTYNEAIEKIQAAFEAAQAALGEKNRVEGEAFLAENSTKPGVITTPSGLQYEVLLEGSGSSPSAADTVIVHYLGTLIDGTVFDTTYERDEPAEIPLDRVIPGWSEGIRMMKEGGKTKLYVPSNLAYGERGAGLIGPNAVIIFEVELLGIAPPQEEFAEEPDIQPFPEEADSE